MNRRTLLRALAAVAAWRLVTRALPALAQTSQPFRVAWVSMDAPSDNPPLLPAFRQGMTEQGQVEGRDFVIEGLWGSGSGEQLEQALRALRARPEREPDVYVAQGGLALPHVIAAGTKRPIVYSISADPVAAGVADTYAHPGHNATGITLFTAELAGKRIAMIKEAIPSMKRLAIIENPDHPGAPAELRSAREVAARLAVDTTYYPFNSAQSLDAALAQIARTRPDAILAFTDGFALASAARIASFAVDNKIPVMSGWADFAERGTLMTYGPVFFDVYRRLATYVVRIRQGAKAGDLPLEQPTKLELVINARTAKALGIALPQSLLVRADRIID